MEKMQEEITVQGLKKGDVIGTRSMSDWPYGAIVEGTSWTPGHKLRVFDRNGYRIGECDYSPDVKVWVEREVKVEGHGYLLLLDMMQDYAPDAEAREIATAHLKKMQSGGATEKEIDLAMAGALLDGLRHGNWPWV